MANRAVETTVNDATPALGTLGNLRRRALGVGLRPSTTWALARLALDAAMLLTAAVAALMGSEAAGVSAPPGKWLLLFSLLVAGVFVARGMYGTRLRFEMLEDVRVVLTVTSLVAMGILSAREIVGDPPDLAAQTIRMWAFAAVYLTAGRVALHWSRAKAHRHGESLRPTLIIGAGKIGRLTAKRLLEHPEVGLKPIGFLDKDPMAAEDGSLPMPVLGASWDLDRVVAQHDVQQVIITFSRAPHEVLLRLVKRCEELGLQVAFVPRLYEKITSKLTIEHLGGIPFISARPSNPQGAQFVIKYAVDRMVAAFFVILTLPLTLLAALGVLMTLGRPLFFRQLRVGRDGRTFEMLKFRTMKPATENTVEAYAMELAPDTAPGGVEGADRRTPLGTILRRTSIDELPQLLNVLKGEMSLIGPRPERPEFVGLFEQSVYRYTERHRVKSGITGWAQVHGLRGKTSLSDRVEWDNYYIENWSLWLDLKVLLLTFLAVVRTPRHVE
ncbi:MAG: exopolysaccharide biosynthesis polyprenyl glycosylphosphotransferase [Actinobacteria bacterium]|nr:exopolysaccharide biosynthesis polyprenyl glycosylphosphotransferase [Actinomycetota bacterium]